jgi:peptide chain release factor subunit 1
MNKEINKEEIDNSVARYEFKRKLEELHSVKGSATELVSLYIPPTRQISDVAKYLRNEYAQSTNIKSRTTRKNVLWAIESLLAKLKYFKSPPENGIAFFVGTRKIQAHQTEPISITIIPPEPITTFYYRCGSTFFTAPLDEMTVEKDIYGLLVIDRKEATIGFLKGKRILTVTNKQSLVPSKHGKGGQSQRRFERLIEIAADEFFSKMASIAESTFLAEKKLKGILVGGPGATKEYFVRQNYLHHELQRKIIYPLFDIGYTDEYGLKELVAKSKDVLVHLSIVREKNIMQKFLKEITKSEGLACYGESDVLNALSEGALSVLLISEKIQKKMITFKCNTCNYVKNIITTKEIDNLTCDKCTYVKMELVKKKDLITHLYDVASKVGTEVMFISDETEEGNALLTTFGGIAGILRYRM